MQRLRVEFRGAQRTLFTAHQPEYLLAGPAGTGKTLACLHKMHLCALKYPSMRGLLLRKTRESLTQTVLVTFNRQVRPDLNNVTFNQRDQEYRYPNGSIVVVGGLDKPQKVMSAEYDLIYAAEATDLLEEDYEAVSTRLRHGVMPYQQLIGDCNPGPPSHWLKRRADRASAAGAPILFATYHEDNPAFWKQGAWTDAALAYLARLDALTGVRRQRLKDGQWASAEGMVFADVWYRGRHLIPRPPIPPSWPRYWSVDFGYTNPFVLQVWAVDPDGRLYRIAELYRTQGLVEDHARAVLAYCRAQHEPRPRADTCDHDAEDRATLERHLVWSDGSRLTTTAASKSIRSGLQAVSSRLRLAGDGRPRLLFCTGALISLDSQLADRHLPTCTEEEVESYVWDTREGRKPGEEPVDRDNHGVDAARYMVAYLDGLATTRRPFHSVAAGERAQQLAPRRGR